MIGQIVIVLLSVFCSNSYFTEALTLGDSLPVFNLTVFNNCSQMTTKAEMKDIAGYAYVVAKSRGPIRCATVTLQPILRINLFGHVTVVGYTTIMYYYAFNDTNYTNLLTTPSQNIPYILIENPSKEGESQSYLSSRNSLNLPTYELITTGEVVGYVGSNRTTLGYATAVCRTSSEDINVNLFVKNRPPQNAVVSQLKAQLPDNGLQGIQLYDVYHGSNCPYYKP